MIEQEVWKDIPGYEGIYQVSNTLNIRSLSRESNLDCPCCGTTVKVSILKEKTMTQRIDTRGYKSVILSKDGRVKQFSVHRAVALAFIPNLNNKPFVNHKNGIKTDNRIENLEWVTAKENIQHAVAMGLRGSGCNAPTSKLTEEDVSSIRTLYTTQTYTQKELAEMFDVTQPTISDLLAGNTYKA